MAFRTFHLFNIKCLQAKTDARCILGNMVSEQDIKKYNAHRKSLEDSKKVKSKQQKELLKNIEDASPNQKDTIWNQVGQLASDIYDLVQQISDLRKSVLDYV